MNHSTLIVVALIVTLSGPFQRNLLRKPYILIMKAPISQIPIIDPLLLCRAL